MSTYYEEAGLIEVEADSRVTPGPNWSEFTSGFPTLRTLETVESFANIAANMVLAASGYDKGLRRYAVERFGDAVEPPLSAKEREVFRGAAERFYEKHKQFETRRQQAAEEEIRLGLA